MEPKAVTEFQIQIPEEIFKLMEQETDRTKADLNTWIGEAILFKLTYSENLRLKGRAYALKYSPTGQGIGYAKEE